MNKADLSKQPKEVAKMFDAVAKRYDITNDILAFGQTRIWRTATLKAVNPQIGEKILDLAAGTGTSSLPFSKAGAKVIAGDFSLGMLQVGKERIQDLTFCAMDALKLPFNDETFDAVTISFGLRNVHQLTLALSEMRRVLKTGGRLVICEFSSPTNRIFNRVYFQYLLKYLPKIAKYVSSNPQAYEYLAESIQQWPNQTKLAAEIKNAGFSSVAWRDLTFGIVALHRGRK
jgi:demethylmenaquinone methyltransferase / 2-methoxy-6-polyprenyl-1,4-benzoquinol methylase